MALCIVISNDRPDLSSEGAPDIDKTITVTVINIWSRAPDGARHQDGLTIGHNVTLTDCNIFIVN
jgi:hypothetical protein